MLKCLNCGESVACFVLFVSDFSNLFHGSEDSRACCSSWGFYVDPSIFAE